MKEFGNYELRKMFSILSEKGRFKVQHLLYKN